MGVGSGASQLASGLRQRKSDSARCACAGVLTAARLRSHHSAPAPTATAAATPAPPGRTEQLGFKPQVACQQLINNVDEPNGLRLKSKKKARKGRKVPVGRGPAEPALRPPRPCWWPTALAWPRLSRRGRATPLAPLSHSSNTQRSQRRGAAVSGAHNDC